MTEKKKQRAAELTQKRKEVEEAQKRVEKLRGKVEHTETKPGRIMKKKDGGREGARQRRIGESFIAVI